MRALQVLLSGPGSSWHLAVQPKPLGYPLQCGLLHFFFRLSVYRQGTEADWTFLDLLKLHTQGYPRTMWHNLDQDVARLDLVAESYVESFAHI